MKNEFALMRQSLAFQLSVRLNNMMATLGTKETLKLINRAIISYTKNEIVSFDNMTIEHINACQVVGYFGVKYVVQFIDEFYQKVG